MTLPHATGYHAPVMVREVMDLLRPERGGTFLDGTLGGGGHAEALLERGPEARLYGVDRDPDALAEAGERLARFGPRFTPVRANFADAVEAAGIAPGTLDGVLLDLGISSHQIDEDARGFTFRPGAPLDMRMGQASAGESSAADLLNELDEQELANLFYRYGEEKRSRKLARIVLEMRAVEPFAISDQLLSAISRTLGPRAEAADKARIFQALRIAVNGEIQALERALESFREALAPGGVFAVLAYHSLEDRLVKNAFRDWSQECVCPPGLPVCRCRGRALGRLMTRKPMNATPEEIAANPRARSAHLRGWSAA
ncbi:16S rRNA (cytosine(1402)-N(4))-methyltransferase RsmH [Longimicrobium terrae]|uniref:Ribosomal RNA small subunit methyltransferase H n=1 Tax=Longimicrobium terrae TaxID=1639882 RepID=A0A841H4B5_9BACT|nr:16S rRNA (cytosine1402-N4)-methyltransferase [Longimicrobium terrae]MBB6072813.1 16S rRNA (cytosine1402-N4)-methyltransferase [Longimicrobium terrae]